MTRSVALNPYVRAAARLLPIALLVLLVGTAAMLAVLRWQAVVRRDLVGTDLDYYRILARRFLDSGSQYLPYQLTGPYDSTPELANALLPSLYPPPAILLFAPFLVLPSVLWWAIPLATIVLAIWHWRPARWTLLVVAACLALPDTTTPVMVGNSTMWAVAAIAAGLLVGWPAAALMIKPTFLPFAFAGFRHRWFWAFAGILLVATVPFVNEWARWFTSLRYGTANAGYSLSSYPAAVIPVVCWLGRRRPSVGTLAR